MDAGQTRQSGQSRRAPMTSRSYEYKSAAQEGHQRALQTLVILHKFVWLQTLMAERCPFRPGSTALALSFIGRVALALVGAMALSVIVIPSGRRPMLRILLDYPVMMGSGSVMKIKCDGR